MALPFAEICPLRHLESGKIVYMVAQGQSADALFRAPRSKSTQLPFPDWPAPTPEACSAVVVALASLHGMPCQVLNKVLDPGAETAPCGGVPSIIDAVVRTILSQHTSDARARLAIAGLEARFKGDYEAVRTAPAVDIAAAIADGGLTQSKSVAIKGLLNRIYSERGDVSLEYLRTLSNTDIKVALMRHNGIGLKTASCILLLCLGRNSFPVDTHVFRIVKRLGWVPPYATREQAHWHLEARVPPMWHYPLHLLFIRHGKACSLCAARQLAKIRQLQPQCPVTGIGSSG